jgi:hypothetical protein
MIFNLKLSKSDGTTAKIRTNIGFHDASAAPRLLLMPYGHLCLQICSPLVSWTVLNIAKTGGGIG